MQYGTLIVEVTVAQQALPIEGAAILVTNEDQTINLRLSSGANGKSPVIRIEAPDRELSLNPDNQTTPYAQVHVTVSKAGFADRTFRNVQIFAQEEALLQVDLLNADEELAPQFEEFIEIPEHALTRSMARSCGCSRGGCCGFNESVAAGDAEESIAPYILDYPIIPKYVTVHLGRRHPTPRM